MRRFGWLLTAVGVLPVAALLAFYVWKVPLGLPGKFTYLYSPIVPVRAVALPAALVSAVIISVGVALISAQAAARRRIGSVCVVAGVVALGIWAFAAPPQYLSQHNFNMNSPSHDGAFLTESRFMLDRGVGRYLADFPDRTRTPREEMRGTRVLSNPPGTTLLAGGVRATLDSNPGLAKGMFDFWVGDPEVAVADRLAVTRAIVFALILHALWLAAWPAWYGIARLSGLPPSLAAGVATVVLITPATLGFAPGKDPVQLLTAALPLFAWLAALRVGSSARAAVMAAGAGGLVVLVAYVGLIHIWLCAVVLFATLLSFDWRPVALKIVLPASIGAALTIGLMAALGIDWIATMRAVAAAQNLVTRGPDAMPWFWQLLGVPLFLLFAGPGTLMAIAALVCFIRRPHEKDLADSQPRFASLFSVAALLSVVVMLGTVVFTNAETPRSGSRSCRSSSSGAAHASADWLVARPRALAAVVLIHLAVSLAEWTIMDMREAENRLAIRPGQPARMFD